MSASAQILKSLFRDMRTVCRSIAARPGASQFFGCGVKPVGRKSGTAAGAISARRREHSCEDEGQLTPRWRLPRLGLTGRSIEIMRTVLKSTQSMIEETIRI